MSLRVRCTKCQTAFLAPGDEPGTTIECPKCGARHRLPEPHGSQTPSQPPVAVSELSEAGAVFVPSIESRGRTSRRRWIIAVFKPGHPACRRSRGAGSASVVSTTLD